jgi:hypothetical protein
MLNQYINICEKNEETEIKEKVKKEHCFIYNNNEMIEEIIQKEDDIKRMNEEINEKINNLYKNHNNNDIFNKIYKNGNYNQILEIIDNNKDKIEKIEEIEGIGDIMNNNKYYNIGRKEEKEEKYFEEDNKKIEDLEIEDNSNVMIYMNERVKGEEFINIYSGARIMITTKGTINNDRYKELPITIENVIIAEIRDIKAKDDKEYIQKLIKKNKKYDIRDDFEMMRFMKVDTFEKYINEVIIPNKRYNEQNKNGETALICAFMNRVNFNYRYEIYMKYEKIIQKLSLIMSKEGLESRDIYNNSILDYSRKRMITFYDE